MFPHITARHTLGHYSVVADVPDVNKNHLKVTVAGKFLDMWLSPFALNYAKNDSFEARFGLSSHLFDFLRREVCV